MNLGEYRALVKKSGRTPKLRRREEHILQCTIARWLERCLPEDILWTASAAGARVGPQVASDLVAAGVKAGWPDLQFLFPDGVTRYIELKTPTGSLEPAQRTFRDHAVRHGVWAVCRSLEDVIATLARWGVAPVKAAA